MSGNTYGTIGAQNCAPLNQIGENVLGQLLMDLRWDYYSLGTGRTINRPSSVGSILQNYGNGNLRF